jgi:hypothetical protein
MSPSHDPPQSDLHIREAQYRVAQQEALVRRMIAQGTATQAAEDRLHLLQERLARMRKDRGHARAVEVQR